MRGRILCLSIFAFALIACDHNEAEKATSSPSISQNKHEYIEFLDDGRIWAPPSSSAARSAATRTSFPDSLAFTDSLTSLSRRLESDTSLSNHVISILDNVCPKLLLAAFQTYGEAYTSEGAPLLTIASLKDQCRDIGYHGTNANLDTENDPYAAVSPKTAARSAYTNDWASAIDVEIYPYIMSANTFKNSYLVATSSGAETQFKKRQRVLTWSGMRWRFDDFNPDRTGIRTYCIEVNGELGQRSSSDAENNEWYNSSDYIAERCSIDLPFTKVSVGIKYYYENDTTATRPYADAKGWHFPKKWSGGIVGMHYVKHGPYEFYARTSRDIPSSLAQTLSSSFEFRK